MNMKWFSFVSQMCCVVMLCLCSQVQGAELGKIAFPASGSPEAQPYFIQGVLLLHSFEYQDARTQFQKAQEIDPNFVMAYWGEAMTHYAPIWAEEDPHAAQAVLQRLDATLAKGLAKEPTQREKDYLQTLDVLWGEGDTLERNTRFSQAMQKLHETYPDDLEAASFYALSILGTAMGKRDYGIYMRAGAIAQDVFEKNPQHPGAAHYVIHAFDDAIHAPLGLKAARAYAQIAPEAPHALHMPSHIFMPLGMWDETTASNEASMAASHKKGKDGLHAAWWLTYSYLQQGRYRKAEELIKRLEQRYEQDADASLRSHLAYMQAAYLVETRQWEKTIDNEVMNAYDFRLRASSSILLAKGLQAIELGNIHEAENLFEALKNLPEATSWSTDLDVQPVIIKAFNAMLHFAKGDREKALTIIQEAADMYDSNLEFGPPHPIKPVNELYGEMLLALNRPAAAEKRFQKALEQYPRRARSLLGLARAAAAAGHISISTRAYAGLKAIWHQADRDVPELQEVSQGANAPHVARPVRKMARIVPKLELAPLPKDVVYQEPSPDLPPNLSALLGQWQGNWGEKLNAFLIFEEVHLDTARVIYGWGTYPPWGFKEKGQKSSQAAIETTGTRPKIEFSLGKGTFTFYLNQDLKTLTGYVRGADIQMHKTAAPAFKK